MVNVRFSVFYRKYSVKAYFFQVLLFLVYVLWFSVKAPPEGALATATANTTRGRFLDEMSNFPSLPRLQSEPESLTAVTASWVEIRETIGFRSSKIPTFAYLWNICNQITKMDCTYVVTCIHQTSSNIFLTRYFFFAFIVNHLEMQTK